MAGTISSIDLLALTAQSGLPLFSRRVANDSMVAGAGARSPITTMIEKDGHEPISLNTIATLYGVNLFARLNGNIQLHQATTEDGSVLIHWKCFPEPQPNLDVDSANVVFILIANNVDTEIVDLSELLDLIFKLILMLCGREVLSTTTNVELLKGHLRLAHSAIDYLLRGAITTNLQTFEIASKSTSYAFTSRSSFICSIVNTIAANVCSEYCAIFTHGRLLSASKAWWAKLANTDEAFHLFCLINSLTDTELIHTKEIPIYLPSIEPFSASARPLRLIVSQVSRELKLCLLIAADVEHSLDRIETDVIVPLNDTKLQEEKLAKYIFGPKTSDGLPPSVLTSMLGHNVVLLENVAGFVFWHRARRLHFVYNEIVVAENADLLLTLAKATDTNLDDHHQQTHKTKYLDQHLHYDQLAIYQVEGECHRLSVVFDLAVPSTAAALAAATTPSSTSSSVLMQVLGTTSHQLAEAIIKAKHFWM